jgi:hypothetical protein
MSPEQQQSAKSIKEIISDSEGNISVNLLCSEEYLRIPSILCRKGMTVEGSPENRSEMSARIKP